MGGYAAYKIVGKGQRDERTEETGNRVLATVFCSGLVISVPLKVAQASDQRVWQVWPVMDQSREEV